jgi:spectinomycin phosphotransferase/16S rRNA (guanine(1405)-N(7))-methyltransferase
VLAPPDDLPDDLLVSVLASGWRVAATSTTYRPVGFGSHHWEIVDATGVHWFATADELDVKRHSPREPLTTALRRLRSALAAATALRDLGHRFVVAPVPTRDGEPLVRAGGRFGVALYPFVDGQSFPWGEFATPAHRHAVLDLVVTVHTAPPSVHRLAWPDDFAIPHREELAAALDPAGGVEDCGPYASATAGLLAEHAVPTRELLARYDRLVGAASQPSRAVLTHGEPHPGNTMLTPEGWCLIDWDTALAAPPERDLWSLDPGDGSVLRAYAGATGVAPLPSMLELYRIRWDLADIAVCVSRFRKPHAGDPDDDKSWEVLRSLVEHLSGGGRRA